MAAATKADIARAFINRIATLPAPIVKAARSLALERVGKTEVNAFAVVLQRQFNRLLERALPTHDIQALLQRHAGDAAMRPWPQITPIPARNDSRDWHRLPCASLNG